MGADFCVEAEVYLGELRPNDVTVELFLGSVDANGEMKEGRRIVMGLEKSIRNGSGVYKARTAISSGSGLYGYTVRVLPHHPDLVDPFRSGLITWASV